MPNANLTRLAADAIIYYRLSISDTVNLDRPEFLSLRRAFVNTVDLVFLWLRPRPFVHFLFLLNHWFYTSEARFFRFGSYDRVQCAECRPPATETLLIKLL